MITMGSLVSREQAAVSVVQSSGKSGSRNLRIDPVVFEG
jgi:hypothetical protein